VCSSSESAGIKNRPKNNRNISKLNRQCVAVLCDIMIDDPLFASKKVDANTLLSSQMSKNFQNLVLSFEIYFKKFLQYCLSTTADKDSITSFDPIT